MFDPFDRGVRDKIIFLFSFKLSNKNIYYFVNLVIL